MWFCGQKSLGKIQFNEIKQISFIFIYLFILIYCSGFYHTLTWISHGFTCVPVPDPPFHLPLQSRFLLKDTSLNRFKSRQLVWWLSSSQISPSLSTAPITQKYIFCSHICSDTLDMAYWSTGFCWCLWHLSHHEKWFPNLTPPSHGR